MNHASLPSEEVEVTVEDAIDLAEQLAFVLDRLRDDDEWVTWNLSGAVFGHLSHRRGRHTAQQFAVNAHRLHVGLQAVADSFDHRRHMDAENAQIQLLRERA